MVEAVVCEPGCSVCSKEDTKADKEHVRDAKGHDTGAIRAVCLGRHKVSSDLAIVTNPGQRDKPWPA